MRKQGFKIPTEAKKLSSLKYISTTATNTKSTTDNEAKRFNIGYRFYDQKLCEMKGMGIGSLRSALEKYKNISKYSTVKDLRSDLGFKYVKNSNHYSKFYRVVEDDVQIEEFRLANGCRTFFYIDPATKIIEIIAMSQHPEEKKNKR